MIFPWVNFRSPYTSRKALVNATQVLWKTRTKPKKVRSHRSQSFAWFQCRRTKYEDQAEREPQNKMRPGQPPDRIRPCVPALACHRWRRNDGFSPTALEAIRVPLSPKPVADTSPCGHVPTTAAGPATLSCSEEQFGGGGRNARATSRACARSLDFPRQFTLENHRLPLALPQSFGKLRNFHVSLPSLSARSCRVATPKSCAVVKNLWTMRLPCGSPRKTENYSRGRHPLSIIYTP